jgi:hypothetical protein
MEAKKYFTLREAHDEQRHIGTIGVDIFTNAEIAKKQFNEKIEQALSEHFDEPCKLVDNLNPSTYISTDPHTEKFTFTYDGDNEPHEEEFEIEQTWMY